MPLVSLAGASNHVSKIATLVCCLSAIVLIIIGLSFTLVGHLLVLKSGETSSRAILNTRGRANATVGVCSELSATENVCSHDYNVITTSKSPQSPNNWLSIDSSTDAVQLGTSSDAASRFAFVPIVSDKRRNVYYLVDITSEEALTCKAPETASSNGGSCTMKKILTGSNDLTEWEFEETVDSDRAFHLIARPGSRCTSLLCQLADQNKYYLSCDPSVTSTCKLMTQQGSSSLLLDLKRL